MAQLDTANGEDVIFSIIVLKFNRWNMKQERTLLLTNFSLYNIKKDQVQRKIAVNLMNGLSKSMKKDILEFIVHVKDEYDYRFECSDHDSITKVFDACKNTYWKSTGVNLPVYGVPNTLKEFGTSKKDIA